jgi:hypothetical protein
MNLQYWIINNNTFPKKRNCKWFVIKKLISQYFLKYSIREIYVMDHSSIWIDVPNFKKLLFVYLFSFVSYHQNPNKISSKIDDSYCCFFKKNCSYVSAFVVVLLLFVIEYGGVQAPDQQSRQYFGFFFVKNPNLFIFWNLINP